MHLPLKILVNVLNLVSKLVVSHTQHFKLESVGTAFKTDELGTKFYGNIMAISWNLVNNSINHCLTHFKDADYSEHLLKYMLKIEICTVILKVRPT